MKLSLSFLTLLLAACSSGPTMRLADGSVVNLGFSILENTTSEGAKFTGPNGVSLTYAKTGKNETSGVTQLAVSVAGARAVTAWAGTKNATTAANAAVAKNASNNAAAVTNATTAARTTVTGQAIQANPGAVVPPVITAP